MTQAMTENLNSMFAYRGRIFYVLVVGIVILTISYVSLIRSAIVNVVEREKIVNEIRERSTNVSELEANYFSIKNKINMDLARAKGFEDSEVSSYISKKSLTAFVSNDKL